MKPNLAGEDVRKTWEPVGQTPILRHCYRHDRISAISGIAVSPRRFHCTLYCQLFEDNIQGEEAALFLRHLLHQIRGHLIVLWDNGKIHRGDPVQELLLRTRRLYLVPFLSYAPELNPDEGVWNHLKNRLANGRPDTQAELMDVLADEICRLAASPGLLRSCIQHSELPPFLPFISISILQGKSKLGEMSEGQEESGPEIRTGRAGTGVLPQ